MTFFTDDEVDTLVCAYLRGGPASEADLVRFLGWAEMARLDNELVNSLLAGKVEIAQGASEPDSYVFRATKLVKEAA